MFLNVYQIRICHQVPPPRPSIHNCFLNAVCTYGNSRRRNIRYLHLVSVEKLKEMSRSNFPPDLLDLCVRDLKLYQPDSSRRRFANIGDGSIVTNFGTHLRTPPSPEPVDYDDKVDGDRDLLLGRTLF